MKSLVNQEIQRVVSSLRRTLTSKEQQTSGVILLLIGFNSIVELLGLATVLPVIGAVVDPSGENSAIVGALRNAAHDVFGLISDQVFIQLLVGLMITGFLIKALFSVVLTWVQTRFSFRVALRIQRVMWEWHFGRSLEKMREIESGQLLTEISNWPVAYSKGVLLGMLTLITDSMVLFLIILGLFTYNAQVFIGVVVIGLFGTLLLRLTTSSRLKSYSHIRKTLDPKLNTTLNNAIKGVLELLAFNAVSVVMDRYMIDARRAFDVMSKSQVISAIPTRLYELLAVGCVGSTILYIVHTSSNDEGVEMIGLLAIAAYRIIPSLSRVNQRIMNFRSAGYLITWMDEVNEALRVNPISKAELDGQHVGDDACVIQIENLELRYQGGQRAVISDLNFSFVAGRIYGVVGRSGCGKSTLMNAILGLHKPSNGAVSARDVKGGRIEIDSDILSNWLAQFAFLPQDPYLFGGTVKENLDLAGRHEFDEESVWNLMMKLGLDEVFGQKGFQFQLNEGGTNLSGGQRQRLALTRALLLSRPVLVLDEATSALDNESRDGVMALLREYSRSRIVILVTHDRQVASQCDEVLDLES